MAYRPGAVRQVLISKEGKPVATRPLGISNVEDKIIQGMTKKILEAIYEPIVSFARASLHITFSSSSAN